MAVGASVGLGLRDGNSYILPRTETPLLKSLQDNTGHDGSHVLEKQMNP